ncbi:aminotransferase class V-fold PLP-dependent enzyme [Azomonas macrocytogenes]|uniref:Selenocysteine lyase/cysteine desulfurase n=1 Tax=Azomonas macrocytogenes TaxID=69962 RepID=A0A839T998_AZOMA|nr:aminotransferase class V-fold PLP-dependent enzyme [Azomonas macrocytogenes]MBB3104794.1 selenocysteine lyase/cysteine desulfurase [Azomonas macrocytogenes]
MSDRRTFLKQAGIFTASLPLTSLAAAPATTQTSRTTDNKWVKLRDLFQLDWSYAHFANFLITSHPKPVRDAIESYRAQLDTNPGLVMDYERQTVWNLDDEVRSWAGRYLDVKPGQIALTGSTTQGLSLVYTGIHIKQGQEILTSTHEHSSAYEAMEFRTQSDGTQVRKIPLFKNAYQVSADEVLDDIKRNIRPNTRVLGLTWVHSSSGVKLPIGEIGQLVRELNRNRDADDRILFCVDGVHGFGIENATFADFNCDFFISGTHKWLFGARGTGIICAASEEMKDISPTFATFSPGNNFAGLMSPGGYHAFEHRWAVSKAFELHLQLGKGDVQERIHSLNSYCKQRLQELKNIELVTPLSPELSSGFTFFRVKDVDQEEVGAYLVDNKIIADAVLRDAGQVTRMAPSLLNNEAEVDRVIDLLARKYKPTS